MITEIQVIQGGVAKDQRGQMRFVNDCDLSEVKRFYIIKNADTELIRVRRSYRIEQRWFYVLPGIFTMDLAVNNIWEKPNPNLPIHREVPQAHDVKVLLIPSGYGTAFRAQESGSELLDYSDYPISHETLDDYSWSSYYFVNVCH